MSTQPQHGIEQWYPGTTNTKIEGDPIMKVDILLPKEIAVTCEPDLTTSETEPERPAFKYHWLFVSSLP